MCFVSKHVSCRQWAEVTAVFLDSSKQPQTFVCQLPSHGPQKLPGPTAARGQSRPRFPAAAKTGGGPRPPQPRPWKRAPFPGPGNDTGKQEAQTQDPVREPAGETPREKRVPTGLPPPRCCRGRTTAQTPGRSHRHRLSGVPRCVLPPGLGDSAPPWAMR